MPENDLSSLLNKFPSPIAELLRRYWRDWNEACARDQLDPDDGMNLPEVINTWACSDFVAKQCIRRPQLLHELTASGDLERVFTAEDYRHGLKQLLQGNIINDMQLMQQLRQFRQRQMVRIAWRDLNNHSATSQTLHELSWLADACVADVLEYLYQDACQNIGVPMSSDGQAIKLLVLGMGKLGAYELNFSSDIDLIFAFAEQGEVQGRRSMANSEFFTRLAQRLIKLLNETTADGFVFRVDTRLRPYGDSGPLVMSFSGMEQYYQLQGRDWERYAMIKARVMNGETESAEELMAMLKPFIYRRYLDFGAFASIREMKAMIENEIRRKGMAHNIKLGEGGIREIEFIGQTFQLVRGGRVTELQIRGIVDVLNTLAQLDDLPEQAVAELIECYEFLRRLENRLQMYGDAQTHNLPDDDLARSRIAYAMGYDDWSQLFADTEKYRQRVHQHFEKVFVASQLATSEDTSAVHPGTQVWSTLDETACIHLLQTQGFQQAEKINQLLRDFRGTKVVTVLTDTARGRLNELMPKILAEIQSYEESAVVLERLLEIVQAVLKRSVYLALLNEYPMALTQLVKLCAASPLITHLMAQHPLLLDDLLNPGQLYKMLEPSEMMRELEVSASRYPEDDLELQMDVLRQFKQTQMLRVAAMDVGGEMNVFDVSSQLTCVAEILLQRVYRMAWNYMVEKHGRPVCVIGGETVYPQLAIIAYGKLGGMELGYNSDLDIVFLHDSSGEQQHTDGEKSIDNTVFFARLTQRMIHILNSYTAAGRLYEVDTRLRPDGAKGMLVSNVSAFENYQQQQAWTWEHQALLRARIIVGDDKIHHEFDRIRCSVLMQPRDIEQFRQEVREMRAKMRSNLGSKEPGQVNLKQDAGGIVDIEFMVQYAVLTAAVSHPQLLDYTSMIELIAAMAETGCWDQHTADTLTECYRKFRSLAHQRALQELPVTIDETELQECRAAVKQIWHDLMAEAL